MTAESSAPAGLKPAVTTAPSGSESEKNHIPTVPVKTLTLGESDFKGHDYSSRGESGSSHRGVEDQVDFPMKHQLVWCRAGTLQVACIGLKVQRKVCSMEHKMNI